VILSVPSEGFPLVSMPRFVLTDSALIARRRDQGRRACYWRARRSRRAVRGCGHRLLARGVDRMRLERAVLLHDAGCRFCRWPRGCRPGRPSRAAAVLPLNDPDAALPEARARARPLRKLAAGSPHCSIVGYADSRTVPDAVWRRGAASDASAASFPTASPPRVTLVGPHPGADPGGALTDGDGGTRTATRRRA
jgi:hypothetical protein